MKEKKRKMETPHGSSGESDDLATSHLSVESYATTSSVFGDFYPKKVSVSQTLQPIQEKSVEDKFWEKLLNLPKMKIQRKRWMYMKQ